MKLIPVIIKGKVHRLSERALEILGLEKVTAEEKPILMKKLPPNLEILKIQRKEPEIKEVVPEVAAVEVKKNEDVTVAKEKETKKRRRRAKVGTEK